MARHRARWETRNPKQRTPDLALPVVVHRRLREENLVKDTLEQGLVHAVAVRQVAKLAQTCATLEACLLLQ